MGKKAEQTKKVVEIAVKAASTIAAVGGVIISAMGNNKK